MSGKITNALIRREADTYRAQGLSREARDLYRKLLATAPHLSPDAKAAVEGQLQQIELEIGCVAPEERQALSDEQVAIIKQGWGQQATVEDIITCAESFYQTGRYGDALEELRKLVPKGVAPKLAAGPMAACLVQLHRPEDLPAAVDQLAGELFRSSGEILSFQLALAEKIFVSGRREHCRRLLLHVRRQRGVSAEVRRRLFALAQGLDDADPSRGPGARTDGAEGRGRSGFDRIRGAARALRRRLFSKRLAP